jgi:DnaJ family protein C protein 30
MTNVPSVVRFYSSSRGRVVSYYEILEMSPQASQKQIKAAYYRLSKKYHPDVTEERNAKEKFAMISEAYEVLGNRRTRSLYDAGSLSPSDVGRHRDDDPSSVDEEYREFFKRRSASQFRSRAGAPPTGRTDHFDFDEFYRQHYGEAIRRSQEDKREKERREVHREELMWRMRRQQVLYVAMLLGMVLSTLMVAEGYGRR